MPGLNKDMDDFRILVAEVMASAMQPDSRGPRVFDNFGTEHAQIVIEAMLRAARREICIYAECVNKIVYDGNMLREFLAKNVDGTIRVLVERPNIFEDPDSALFGMKDLQGPHFQVRQTKFKSNHLAIVDGMLVRVENSQPERSAIIGFLAPDLLVNAQHLFDRLWDAAGATSEATERADPPKDRPG
jgi:hypothetical protein